MRVKRLLTLRERSFRLWLFRWLSVNGQLKAFLITIAPYTPTIYDSFSAKIIIRVYCMYTHTYTLAIIKI